MSTLKDRARDIATRAHRGQTDKTGADYIDHPRRVAERTRHYAAADQQEAAQVVAWLHDVVEDTGVTLDDLREAALDLWTQSTGARTPTA